MKVSQIIKSFPQSEKITSRGKYDKVPGLYLIVFDKKTGYVGHSGSIGRRVKDFWCVNPLLRYLGVDPRKYPVYFLRKIKSRKRRERTEKRVIQKFARCLNNVEFTRHWELGNEKKWK